MKIAIYSKDLTFVKDVAYGIFSKHALAALNKRNFAGKTAIRLAADHGRWDILRFLVRFGAEFDADELIEIVSKSRMGKFLSGH